jgi:hypothetical protein
MEEIQTTGQAPEDRCTDDGNHITILFKRLVEDVPPANEKVYCYGNGIEICLRICRVVNNLGFIKIKFKNR